jgi:hypothetical protein
MNHPLRENLEVYADSVNAWIRCTQCSQILCRLGENWRNNCRRRLLPPTKAGPLMQELVGQFLLEQLYCPGCGALLNTEIVEEKKNGKEGQAK